MPAILSSTVIERSGLDVNVPWGDIMQGGLIEPVLFAAIVGLSFKTYEYLDRRTDYVWRLLPLRYRVSQRRLRLGQSAEVSLAYALIPPKSAGHPYYTVEEGDVRALYELHTLLSDRFGRRKVVAYNERDLQDDVHERPNLVVTSGPVWNNMTELYLGLTGSPVVFAWDGPDLKLVGPDREFTTRYVGSHRVKECHGLLIGARATVAGMKQRVVITAGCSNVSTYAGAILLSTLSHDRELRRTIRRSKAHRDDCWAIVFKVANWAEVADAPYIPPMQTGALRLTIEAVYRQATFKPPFEYHIGAPAEATV